MLDAVLIEAVFHSLAEHDVVRGLVAHTDRTAETLASDLARALEQSEHFAMPSGEWPNLSRTLGEPLLASLLQISASCVRRYAGSTRQTPGDVANRLHVLALIVADLAGAYAESGIQRWFSRPRTQLDGSSPRDLLHEGWDPVGAPALRLRGLAAGLVSARAT